MTKKYGVTTIGRWLTEELPRGVKCYIEYRGLCFELLRVTGTNGALWPTLRYLRGTFSQDGFQPRLTMTTLSTMVVLSRDDDLHGEPWEQVAQQLRPSAPNCWALQKYLTRSTDAELNEVFDSVVDSSVYCG
jgi:hypothetical protein